MAEGCYGRYYFAYGSNLWLAQMALRCPGSTFVSIARLVNYRWFISERGYANIVRSPGDEVWGMIYTLTSNDEAALDIYEGVPRNYVKEILPIDLPDGTPLIVLAYMDHLHLVDGVVKTEYINRMSCGIQDARKKGIPVSYVERYMLEPLALGSSFLDTDSRPGSSGGLCVNPN
ncbi:hypothetical protein TWF970_003276 [Orbilia oligospora]|uniref:gamma-glutamylcyclotransferase n=1 Tax=Orbilia oligospora TaxID=2813651 RepID=A0A7C8RLI5_ORBOL|nr:hypothetical protein TWF970_003276 [Orbilia oligospora]